MVGVAEVESLPYDVGVSAPDSLLEIAPSFFNLRCSFRLFGLVDIKTHASLVRLSSGKFLLLDSGEFEPEVLRWLRQTTNDGAKLSAIIHLHPFHTVSATSVHEQFPGSTLYGTRRHQQRLSDLPWADAMTMNTELATGW